MNAIMEALKNVTQADLDTLDAEIGRLRQELDSLTEARKLIAYKLGVDAPKVRKMIAGRGRGRSKAEPEAEAAAPSVSDEPVIREGTQQYTATELHRRRIREFINANGPHSVSMLCKRCSVPAGSITNVLKFHWFRHTGRGVELTPAALRDE